MTPATVQCELQPNTTSNLTCITESFTINDKGIGSSLMAFNATEQSEIDLAIRGPLWPDAQTNVCLLIIVLGLLCGCQIHITNICNRGVQRLRYDTKENLTGHCRLTEWAVHLHTMVVFNGDTLRQANIFSSLSARNERAPHCFPAASHTCSSLCISTERKDPSPVLAAYESCFVISSGSEGGFVSVLFEYVNS